MGLFPFVFVVQLKAVSKSTKYSWLRSQLKQLMEKVSCLFCKASGWINNRDTVLVGHLILAATPGFHPEIFLSGVGLKIIKTIKISLIPQLHISSKNIIWENLCLILS